MKKILLLFICINLNAQTNVLQKADSLLVLGNYKTALVVLESDNSFENLNKSGAIYQQIGNYTKAIEKYKEALVLQTSLKMKENLGKCYQKNNKSDKAILLFEEVLNENNNNLLLKYHLAKLYKSKRQFNKAKKLFKYLINSDNENPNYYYYLGSTYLNLKEKDSAKSSFLKAFKLDSTHFKSMYKLSKLYRKEKIKSYKNLPKKLRAFYQVSNETSYYYLEKGLYNYPKSSALLQLASTYYFKDEKYEQAIRYLTQLHVLKPDEQQDLAVSHYFIGNYEKAKDYLYDLIETRKAGSQTYFYLSMVYKAEKDFEKAILYMDFAIEMEQPQLAPYYFELGLIHQNAKQYPKAIADFKKAVEENQHHYKAYYQLALISDSYYKDKSIALELYKKYLTKYYYKDTATTDFVKQRVKELKTKLFIEK